MCRSGRRAKYGSRWGLRMDVRPGHAHNPPASRETDPCATCRCARCTFRPGRAHNARPTLLRAAGRSCSRTSPGIERWARRSLRDGSRILRRRGSSRAWGQWRPIPPPACCPLDLGCRDRLRGPARPRSRSGTGLHRGLRIDRRLRCRVLSGSPISCRSCSSRIRSRTRLRAHEALPTSGVPYPYGACQSTTRS